MLVDTNVWLERLLDQRSSEEVASFLAAVPSTRLCLTDFTLHSIALILEGARKREVFSRFIADLTEGRVQLLHLHKADYGLVLDAMDRFKLDFDDAYQYVIAELHQLQLASFDADFDRTTRGRQTPVQAVAGL